MVYDNLIKTIRSSASTNDPVLSAVTANLPTCLQTSTVSACVKELPVDALMDTGSSDSYIDASLCKKLDLIVRGNPSTISMASKSHSVKVNSNVNVDLNVCNNQYPDFKLGVMKNLCSDVILGLDFMKLHSKVNFEMNGSKSAISTDNHHLNLCNALAANIEPPKIFRSILSNCVPVATKNRSYSESDKKIIEEEVAKLLEDGVIEPSQSLWRAQVLITKDERHKKRMVIDYSQTVNRFTHLDAYPVPRIDEQINDIAKAKYYSSTDLKSAYYQVPLAKEDREFTAVEANGKLYHYCRMSFGVKNGVSAFQRIINYMIKKHSLKRTYAYLDNVTVTGVDKNEHDRNLAALLDAAKGEDFTFNENKSVYAVTKLDLLGQRVSQNTIKPDPNRLEYCKLKTMKPRGTRF